MAVKKKQKRKKKIDLTGMVKKRYYRAQEVIGYTKPDSHLMKAIKTRTIANGKTVAELVTGLSEAEKRLAEEKRAK